MTMWDSAMVTRRGVGRISIRQFSVSHRDSGVTRRPIKSGFPIQFFQLHTEVKKGTLDFFQAYKTV